MGQDGVGRPGAAAMSQVFELESINIEEPHLIVVTTKKKRRWGKTEDFSVNACQIGTFVRAQKSKI